MAGGIFGIAENAASCRRGRPAYAPSQTVTGVESSHGIGEGEVQTVGAGKIKMTNKSQARHNNGFEKKGERGWPV